MQPIYYTRKAIKDHIRAIRQCRQDRAYSGGSLKLAATMAHPMLMQRLSLELKHGARHRKEPIGYKA